MKSQLKNRLKKIAVRLRSAPLFSKAHYTALRKNHALLASAFPKGIPGHQSPGHPDALPDQLFDSIFLQGSALFQRSRRLFLEEGGRFEPKLTTSPRSLSSLILTENRIEYTPHQSEFLWTLNQRPFPTDTVQKLITYSTSLFHEQNHRLLWNRISPPEELNPETLRQYLNFMESLVIVLDMALGDELGPGLASLGYLTGTLYDPGTEVPLKPKRAYRNALHQALQATFLALEGYDPERIEAVLVGALPKAEATLGRRMIARALRLDSEFIERTNPLWQKRYEKELLGLWKSERRKNRSSAVKNRAFQPSIQPLSWTHEYLVAESIFDEWKL